MTAFLRTLVLGGMVAVLAWGTYEVRGVLRTHERELGERDERIDALVADVEELDARNAQLELALQLVKVDHRLARLSVLDQGPEPGGSGRFRTTVRFQEITGDGAPLADAKTFVLSGKLAYIDALVIKFEDSYVERGDVWRGTSICLFRRIFGEHQAPEEGFPLDPTGKRPAPYADYGDEGADRDLWLRFWDYANDAALAEQAGVRAVHGEAPYVELRPGHSYTIELRASGGLTIRPG
jgi:hypothetical protein